MTLFILLYALAAGIIPSLVWLFFWLREDSGHPEPRWMIVATFIAGGISVIAAIQLEAYTGGLISDQTWQYIIWAAIEEIVKLIAVSIIAWNSSYNDEPIDALIYIITTALGFSAIENALFILSPLSGGNISVGIATETMRFIGATLVHVVSSAVIGFAAGATMCMPKLRRVIFVTLGILGAIAIHASFNLSIIKAQPSEVLGIFSWIWGGVVILIILFEEIKAVKYRARNDSPRQASN